MTVYLPGKDLSTWKDQIPIFSNWYFSLCILLTPAVNHSIWHSVSDENVSEGKENTCPPQMYWLKNSALITLTLSFQHLTEKIYGSRVYTGCERPERTKVNRIMKLIFEVCRHSKRIQKRHAWKESRILVWWLVSLEDRGVFYNFRPHLDTKPALGWWGKQRLPCPGKGTSPLQVSPGPAYFSGVIQNAVHSLGHSRITPAHGPASK